MSTDDKFWQAYLRGSSMPPEEVDAEIRQLEHLELLAEAEQARLVDALVAKVGKERLTITAVRH